MAQTEPARTIIRQNCVLTIESLRLLTLHTPGEHIIIANATSMTDDDCATALSDISRDLFLSGTCIIDWMTRSN